jgi:coenzyme F420-dependent glucose-6-phosphate dehydrogenase
VGSGLTVEQAIDDPERTKKAYLHARGERRPPVYVSAFGPQAADVAGRLGDGVWTMGDPEMGPGQRAPRDHPPGRLLVGRGRRLGARGRAGVEVHPGAGLLQRAEREVSDDAFRESYIVSSDPDQHVECIREIEKLGATVVRLQNGSGSAPERALDVYGERVLPALTG